MIERRRVWFIDEIESIEIIEIEDDYVYDISVEDTERFFAKDPKSDYYILVHNTSMYPSTVKMFNIDFTTLRARVYPPQTYKLIDALRKFSKYVQEFVNTDKPKKKTVLKSKILNLKNSFKESFNRLILSFVEWYKPNKKKEIIENNLKFTLKILDELMYVFAEYTLDGIMNGEDYIVLKTRLIPFLENYTHLLSYKDDETNKLIYFWIVAKGNIRKYKEYLKLYLGIKSDKEWEKFRVIVVDNPTSNKIKIREITIDEFIEKYLKKYVLTFSGALFEKHDNQVGIMVGFIDDYMSLRKQLKKTSAYWYEKGDNFKYSYYDKLQGKVVKPQLNAVSYGVNIVPTFILNDKNIGSPITMNSKFMIKFAQAGVQKYLNKNLEKRINALY